MALVTAPETNAEMAEATSVGSEANAGSTTYTRPLQAKLAGEAVSFERGLVGMIDADSAALRMAGAGAIFASKDVTIDIGAARDVIAGGSVTVTRGGAGAVLARGDARISQGGAAALVSLGRMEIEQGGACMLAAGSASVGRGGIVGLAITPRLEVGEGGRVLSGPAVAAGAFVGFAIGFVLSRLVSRKRS
jgi:hypothetical protein